MKLELDINENDIDWEDNAYIKIMQNSKNLVSIVANKEGLVSLAKQLLAVAYSTEGLEIHHQPEINNAKGYWYGDLEKDSVELYIMKQDFVGRKKVE